MILLLTACWSSFSTDTAVKEPAGEDSAPHDSDPGESGDSDSGETAATDADGDGYTVSEGDCDDAELAVHPGAEEVCNDADDDCDGSADEDAVDMTVWYLDSDGDGYGDDTDHKEACDQPASYVDRGGDCDVVLASVHPEAAEVCNHLDDDCDGGVDVDATDAPTWYEDQDEDGWGGAEVLACEQPAGTLETGGDCDDTDALARPDGTEVCDGVDQDCDGDVDEAGGLTWYADNDGDGLGDDTTATVTCFPDSGDTTVAGDCDDADAAVLDSAPVIVAEDFESGASGETVTTLDCIDGDCTSYYALAPHRGLLAATTRNAGDEIGRSSSSFTEDFTLVVWFYDKRLGGDRFVVELGTSASSVLAWAGFDTDEDSGEYIAETGGSSVPLGARTLGWHRLVVEAVYSTTTSGTLTFALDEESPASLTFTGYMSAFWLDDTGEEGTYVDDLAAWAGTGACAPIDSYTWYSDRDGDGFGEPGSGVFTDEALADVADNVGDCDDGEVLAWAGAEEICEDGVDQDCDGTFDGCGFLGENVEADAESGITDFAWTTVATGRDVNADGSPDLLLGGNGTYIALFTGGWEASQFFALGDALWEDESGGYVGKGIALAPDLDGDGCDDIVSQSYHSNYTVAVISGCTYPTGERNLWSLASATLTSTTPGGDFGSMIAATPDADGDGTGELFIGDHSETGGTHTGVVFRSDGVGTGSINLTTSAAATISGDAGDYLGSALASAGDTEGTGGAGILVGAYTYDGGTGTPMGRVSLFDAGLTGELGYADATWSVDGSAGEYLGNGTSTTAPVAGMGDANGDGYDDVLIGSDQLKLAYVFLGPFGGKGVTSDATITSVASGANGFGRSVCGPIDADGDGRTDAVIGDPTELVGGSSVGRFYLFTAVAAGTLTTDDADGAWTGQGA